MGPQRVLVIPKDQHKEIKSIEDKQVLVTITEI
jgi:hypothetical protein